MIRTLNRRDNLIVNEICYRAFCSSVISVTPALFSETKDEALEHS